MKPFLLFQPRGSCSSVPGIHGLSNSLLDVPWPKVCKGTRLLTEVLQQPTFEAEDLFAILRDREYPADEELPDTGVGLKMERMLGPIFVKQQIQLRYQGFHHSVDRS